MTTSRQFADSEGDFGVWVDHPATCTKLVQQADGVRACGAPVRVRTWDSSCGSYTDYQYRCAVGHVWWIDGIDS